MVGKRKRTQKDDGKHSSKARHGTKTWRLSALSELSNPFAQICYMRAARRGEAALEELPVRERPKTTLFRNRSFSQNTHSLKVSEITCRVESQRDKGFQAAQGWL